jgi:hypothetical protein
MQSRAIQLLESALVFQKRDMTLQQLLYHHEQSKCRESRDKIYGLLALVSDCRNSEIQPDYKKEISEVYRDALTREISTIWEATAAGMDLVFYSYFLRNILSVSVPIKFPFIRRIDGDPVRVVGYSCGTLKEEGSVQYQSESVTLPVVCAISDSQFQAFKGPGLPEMPGQAASSFLVNQKGARIMALSRSRQPVYAPDVAKAEDELCMFSKHDSALMLRKEDDGS